MSATLCKKKNNNPIKAYFSDLEESKDIKPNYSFTRINMSNYLKTNCSIEYDKFSINFLSNYGESFNVTLKNEIINIYPITNGIIIKIKDINSDFSFFKSSIPEKNEKIQYNFYYLTNHPLSSLALLNYQSKNFDIIKSSINYPFLIIRANDEIKLCVIMINKIFNLKNFKESIEKLLNAKNNNLQINNINNLNDNFSSDYTFKLIDLYSFKEININNIDSISKIKFYKNASHKSYLYIAIQLNDKLLIYKIKFGNEYNLKKVEYKEYNNVIEFYLINSLINSSNELLYSFKKNKIVNNSRIIYDYSYDNNSFNYNNNEDEYRISYPLKYLINHNIYSPNKTLVFLQKDTNTLSFIEDICTLFSYTFNLEEKITSFQFEPPNSFQVFCKKQNISGQINLYCTLNEKNNILNILKYLKYEYNEKIYYELLSILFSEIYDKPKKNHLEIFNIIIFSLFSTVFGKKDLFYENFYKLGEKEKIRNNFFNEAIIKDMKKYSVKETILSLFSKVYTKILNYIIFTKNQ